MQPQQTLATYQQPTGFQLPSKVCVPQGYPYLFPTQPLTSRVPTMPSHASKALGQDSWSPMTVRPTVPNLHQASTEQILLPYQFPAVSQRAIQNLQSNLSDEKKLAKATEETLQFIQVNHNDIDKMIRSLQSMGVMVLEGDQHPWVNQYLDNYNAYAMFICPNRVANPTMPFDEAFKITKNEKKIPELVVFDRKTNAQGQLTVMIRSGFRKSALLHHELFHLFQTLNGLPLGQSSGDELESFKFEFEQRFNKTTNIFYNMWQCYKMLVAKSLVKIKLKRDRVPEFSKQQLIAMQRELEAVDFIEKNKDILGIPAPEILANRGRKQVYKLNRDFTYLYGGWLAKQKPVNSYN